MSSGMFEFHKQWLAQNSVDIEEIGQCAIEAWDDKGQYYYLVAQTTLGLTTIATCGPVIPDMEFLPSGFTCALDRMDYKESKIYKAINTFLNPKGGAIVGAQAIEIDDAIEEFRDLKSFLQNYSEENY